MSALAYISVDEGFRRSTREPWTCGNPLCGESWNDKPDTWDCAAGHGVTLCEECKGICRSCGQIFCAACLSKMNYGDGPVLNCIACVKEATEGMQKCASCDAPRVDLREVAEGYEICGECREARKR